MKVVKVAVYLLALTTWVVSASPTQAELPYRNSSVSYRNSVSVISLNKDAELSFNPYYAMTLGLTPQWWFSESVYLQGHISLTRELTDSDVTTQHGETVPSDLRIRLGAADLVRVPGIGLELSAALDVIAPTSPLSRARTLNTAIGAGISLKRRFAWLKGVSLGYSFSFRKGLHRYTTSEKSQPLVPGCTDPVECSELSNTGVRNASYRMVHGLSASVGLLSWLRAHVSGGFIMDTLYNKTQSDAVTHVPQTPDNNRYLVQADMGLNFKPMPSMGLTLGVSTVNPQLAPDATYYTPVFNRYTVIYLDLTLDIAGLVSQVSDVDHAEKE